MRSGMSLCCGFAFGRVGKSMGVWSGYWRMRWMWDCGGSWRAIEFVEKAFVLARR